MSKLDSLLPESVRSAWDGLQARERLVVLAGIVLLFLAALYLLYAQVWQERQTLLEERRVQLAETEWLQDQATLAASLVNTCADTRALPLNNNELLTLLAERNQLVLSQLELGSGPGVQVQVTANDGNRILRFLHQSACQGFHVSTLRIERLPENQGFSGQVEMSRET